MTLHPTTERLKKLIIGQPCFFSGRPQGCISSVNRSTGQTYSREAVDGGYMVTRLT